MNINVGGFFLVSFFFSMYLEGVWEEISNTSCVPSLWDSKVVFLNIGASLCICQGWYQPGLHSNLQGLEILAHTTREHSQVWNAAYAGGAGEGAINLSLLWLLGSLHGAT